MAVYHLNTKSWILFSLLTSCVKCTECENGTYGITCVNKCSQHCRDICDKDTGYCTSCEPEWTGDRCDKECYENTPNQYSGYRNTTAEGFKCQKWTDKSPQYHPTFSSKGFPDKSVTDAANYCRDPNHTGSPFCYTLEPNVRLQYCGIDICKSECNTGTFGENCLQSCNHYCKNGVCSLVDGRCIEGCVPGYWGHYCTNKCKQGTYGQSCINTCSRYCNNKCRNTDGICPDGCQAGYHGDTCKQACDDGKYGENCLDNCSRFCKNNSVCRKTDGVCENGCSAGYIEDKCDKLCDEGRYGEECTHTCSEFCIQEESPYCSNVNGSCLHGCLAGWQGKRCDEKCDERSWGENCERRCLLCSNELCDRISGSCNEHCKPGIKLTKFCDQECDDGWYGMNCSEKCSTNCKEDTFCRKVDGSCLECKSGLRGNHCDIGPGQTADSSINISEGGVAGIVIAFFILIVISVVVTFFVTRKRMQRLMKHNSSENAAVSFSNVLAGENLTEDVAKVYDTINRKSGTEHIYG